jgi:hypothetical protein
MGPLELTLHQHLDSNMAGFLSVGSFIVKHLGEDPENHISRGRWFFPPVIPCLGYGG